MPAPEIVTVPLFRSAHMGYGDARETVPYRYNRIMYGFDARFPGELRFGDYMQNLTTTGIGGPPVWGSEWRDDSGVYLVVVYVSGTAEREIRFSADSARGAAFAQTVTDACFHDNGSGIERLVVAQGRAGNIVIRSIADANDSVGTIVRDKVKSISGALYGSAIPASGSRFSGVSFCPYGSNPATAANWSSTTRVGWAGTDINNIISVRGVPVVIKPEGIFMYNRGRDQWENMVLSWEADPHPDNGRAAMSRGPDAIISVGRGGCILFDGYSIRDVSPRREAAFDGDTTADKLSCLGVWKDWIVAVTSVSQGYQGGAGSKQAHQIAGGETANQKIVAVGNTPVAEAIRFWRTTDNEVTFTNGSNAAGDESLATTIALSSQDTAANGDFFTIGYRYPWRACLIEFNLSVSQRNTAASTLTAEYWNGSAWASMAIVDMTITGSDVTLGKGGLIVLTENPTDWTARTYGTAGVDDAGGHFYIRFSVSATLSASVFLTNVRLLPWRPAIDTVDHPNDGIDRAGCYPHILLGKLTEDGAIWHDMGTPGVADEIGFVTAGFTGGVVGVDARKLLLLGLRNIYLYHQAEVDTWPWLAPRGLVEFPIRAVAQGNIVRLREVRLQGRDFDGIATMSLYYRYDPNERWSKVSLGARPPFQARPKSEGKGAFFQWALGYVMTDTTDPHVARRPVVLMVDADFEVVGGRADAVPQRTIATTPRG